MNKPLLRLTVALVVTFVALIGVVRYAGQIFAVPQQMFSFDPPDCKLPCIGGITPGKTTWDEYKALIDASPATSPQPIDNAGNLLVMDNGSAKVDLLAYYYFNNNPQRAITYLAASTAQGQFATFRKLLNVQPPPVRVFRSRPFGPSGVLLFFVFGDDERIVASAWVVRELSLDTPINFIAVFDSSENAGRELLETLSVDEIHWLGFGPIQKYLNAPIKQ